MATIEASAAGGKWSETTAWEGGVVPGEKDDVVLGAGSGSITISAEAKCRSLEASAYTQTLAATATLAIGYSTSNGGLAIKLGASMSVSGLRLNFVSTSGTFERVSLGGKHPKKVSFGAVGGKWELLEEVNCEEELIAFGAGEVVTNGNTLKARKVSLATGKLVLGKSTVVITGGTTTALWEFASGTLEAAEATIEIVGAWKAGTFAGGGGTYGTVVLGVPAITITGSNTFGTLTLSTAGNAEATKFTQGTTQTITGSLTTNAKSGSLVKMESTEAGKPWKLTKASGVVALNYLELKDSAAEGGAEWYAGANSTSVSGNSGWKFEAAKESYSGALLLRFGLDTLAVGNKQADGGMAMSAGLADALQAHKASAGTLAVSGALRSTTTGRKIADAALSASAGFAATFTAHKLTAGSLTASVGFRVAILTLEPVPPPGYITLTSYPQARITVANDRQAAITVASNRQARITIESE